jgi:hypothetical protein
MVCGKFEEGTDIVEKPIGSVSTGEHKSGKAVSREGCIREQR